MIGRPQLATGALVVAALALGWAVTSRLPDGDGVLRRPFVRAGALGAPVALRTGELTVVSVEAAPRVTQSGTTAGTTGVWLVVTVLFTAAREPSVLPEPMLVAADGRRFGGPQPLSTRCGPAQPGIPIRCTLAYEVTRDALPSARLWAPASLLDGGAGDDAADVDLGIGAGQAEQLLARREPLTVEAVTVVGRP